MKVQIRSDRKVFVRKRMTRFNNNKFNKPCTEKLYFITVTLDYFGLIRCWFIAGIIKRMLQITCLHWHTWPLSTFINAAGALTNTSSHSDTHACKHVHCCHTETTLHARSAGGSVPDAACQTGLEVHPRRSKGPPGWDKPFPPPSRKGRRAWGLQRMMVVRVRGRVLSAERNSKNVVL